MRLLTFRVDGAGRTGLLRPDGSNEAVEREDVDHMLDLIDAGPEGLAHALDHIFGFVALNDVSARDIQFGWGGQFFKGRSLDGFCPIGPWIVTPDEIEDPQSLRLSLRVNGVVKQDGNTRDMIYPVDAVIEWVSKGMTP